MEKSKELIEKYLAGECNEEERQLVESWYNQEIGNAAEPNEAGSLEGIGDEIWERIHPPASLFSKYIKYFALARVFCLVDIFTLIKFQHKSLDDAVVLDKQPKNAVKIVPGITRATLTLANGKRISLDSMESKRDVPFELSQIVAGITNSRSIEDVSTAKHRIDVPKGGELHFVLADGTKVWLNSETTLHFLAKFQGAKREVILEGEAYFEVATNKAMPFREMANGTEIDVLGTHFNVSSYGDEHRTVVTLAEGSVLVGAKASSVVLRPSQSAEIKNSSSPIKVRNVQLGEVLAWKDGFFVFDESSIQRIMKVLSTWYDFNISYRGKITEKKFGGTFSRSKDIVDLLKSLESFGGVHFKIEGRTVTVSE